MNKLPLILLLLSLLTVGRLLEESGVPMLPDPIQTVVCLPKPRGTPLPDFAPELRCRCCGACRLDAVFIKRLAALQARLPYRLNFTSGYRCAAHNARVGGVRRSRHLCGQAADVAVPPSRQRGFCTAARACGFRRVLPDARRGYVHISL